MSLPKKTLIACASAAALITSIGFVQAQSPDQDASAELHLNDAVDTRTYDADRLPANNYDPGPMSAADSAAPASADAAMSQPANDTASANGAWSANVAAAEGHQNNVGIRGTPGIPEGSAGQRSYTYDPAVVNGTGTAPVGTSSAPAAPATTAAPTDYNSMPATAAGTTGTTGNMGSTAATGTSAATTTPSETRVDLSPPSDPLYNLPQEGSERAPRQDRN